MTRRLRSALIGLAMGAVLAVRLCWRREVDAARAFREDLER